MSGIDDEIDGAFVESMMRGVMSGKLTDPLEECIEKFWTENPDMKRLVLQDWYARGYVSRETDDAGRRAVDKWLASAPNGDRGSAA